MGLIYIVCRIMRIVTQTMKREVRLTLMIVLMAAKCAKEIAVTIMRTDNLFRRLNGWADPKAESMDI